MDSEQEISLFEPWLDGREREDGNDAFEEMIDSLVGYEVEFFVYFTCLLMGLIAN